MWHEARKSERKVHDLMDAARKRAQRRAAFLARRRGEPHQTIQAVGNRCRVYRDDGLYQAAEDHQGLIPWNGKEDVMIDRFDGRALLDFIRDPVSRPKSLQEKTREEEELEEFVNFERYRDLIKHKRRGFADEEGLQDTSLVLEAKANALFTPERSVGSQASTTKGPYSQVGFSYTGGGGNDEAHSIDDDTEDEDEDDDEDDFSSDDSHDEGIDKIAKDFGIKRYNWLLYKDKKDIEEKKQMEVSKGEPGAKKLTRKERRKASKIEREKERESFRAAGRAPYHDPYREQRRSPTYDAYPRSRRSRSRSRSYSPSRSRRYRRDHSSDNGGQRSKLKAPKIEFITEFGGSDSGALGQGGISPPSSPPSHADTTTNRSSAGRILEALHVDPASGASFDPESSKAVKPSPSGSSTLTKLSKIASSGPPNKQQIEKKETPQERLKRIMSKQLNKQIKKDAAADIIKKKEQELQRKERLAEASRYRDRSRSRTRSRSRSRTRSRSPRKYNRSRSRSWSRSRTPQSKHRRRRSRSRSRSPSSGRDKSSRRR